MEISGSIYIILTALCWSFGGLFLKFVTGNVIAVAGIRSLSGLIALMLITRRLPCFRVKNDDGTTSKDSKYLWLCAFCSAATMILYVIANRLTTAANAILLQYSDLIWIILIGPFLLGEHNKKSDYLTVLGVFVGMCFFFADELRAGFENMNIKVIIGDCCSILSGVTMSLTTMLLRKQKNGGKGVDSYMLSMLFVSLITLPFIIKNGLPDSRSLIFMILAGVINCSLPAIFYPMGLKTVSALSAMLISLLEPLMNPIWVLIFYGEIPSILCIIGGVMIISFVIIREILHKKQFKNG